VGVRPADEQALHAEAEAHRSGGRWRCYTYDEILKRDKLSLDLFWIKDKSLTDSEALPAPDILAAEIADELEAAFELFSKIAAKLPKSAERAEQATEGKTFDGYR
jgi:hypothetical protein